MKERHQIRIIFFGLFIFLTFTLLVTRLYQLQIVQGDYFRLWADRNRFRLVPLNSSRGIMYDREGNILVRNVPSFTVTLIPAYLPDDPQVEAAVYQRLSELLGLPATKAGIEEVLQELGTSREDAGMGGLSIEEMVDEVRA
ncbi:MAG: hypothetical protein JSV36_07060, partial [Anaerolineae bacterium]